MCNRWLTLTSAHSYEWNVKHRPLCTTALNSNQLHNKFSSLFCIIQSRSWVLLKSRYSRSLTSHDEWRFLFFIFFPLQERKCVQRDFFCFECSGFKLAACSLSRMDYLYWAYAKNNCSIFKWVRILFRLTGPHSVWECKAGFYSCFQLDLEMIFMNKYLIFDKADG